MTTVGDTFITDDNTYPQSVPVSPKSVVRSPQSTVHTFQFAARSPRSTVHKQRSEVDGVSPPCTVCSLQFTVRGPQSKIFCLQSVIFVNFQSLPLSVLNPSVNIYRFNLAVRDCHGPKYNSRFEKVTEVSFIADDFNFFVLCPQS